MGIQRDMLEASLHRAEGELDVARMHEREHFTHMRIATNRYRQVESRRKWIEQRRRRIRFTEIVKDLKTQLEGLVEDDD